MIKISDLHKKYKRKKVLQSISIEFEQAKVYGIIGKNGAGKSTLFKCISGLIKYEGNISSTSQQKLKNTIGYLPTHPFSMKWITGQEYLNFCLKARGMRLSGENLNVFDLPLKNYIDNYSTGMLKKLAFSAILMQENEFFLLDEPFNGLDLEGSILMKEIILMLREQGKTVILSSHIFSVVREICDEKILLQDGKLFHLDNAKAFEDLEKEVIKSQKDKVQSIKDFIN